MSEIESVADYVEHVYDHQLVLLCALALLMGLGKGGVPGFATIATALTVSTAPPGGLGYAVALQVPVLTTIDVSAAWLHRRILDWSAVRTLLPTSLLGMAIGQFLDRYLTDARARLLVGTILLAILALKARDELCPRREVDGKDSDGDDDDDDDDVERRRPSRSPSPSPPRPAVAGVDVWAVVVGLVGGTATMLTNSMGPILNVYLLSVRRLSPAEYVGTRAVFFCFVNVLGKLPLRVLSGTLGPPMFLLAAGLGAVSVLGVLGAGPILRTLDERTFVRLELAVVTLAGARLFWAGLTATTAH